MKKPRRSGQSRPSAPAPPSPSPRNWVPPLIAATALSTLTYLQTLGFGFAFDDNPIIVRNPVIRSGDWHSILGARWFDSLYRPATMLSLAADWMLGNGQPALFHFENLLLHLLVTAGVFALAYPLCGTLGAATAALLFAVHPVHVEAVANIVGRAELLAALGVVACALCYRADARLGQPVRRRALAWLGTLASALLAMASKETSLVLPALLLAVDWVDARAANESLRARLRRHLPLWVTVTALWALWLAFWLSRADLVAAQPVSGGLVGLSLPLRALSMLQVVPQYARLLLFPIHLSADYSPRYFDVSSSITPPTVLGAMVIASAAWVVFAARRRLPGVAAGLAWTAISLITVSNLIAPSEILLAERTMYLPSIGVSLALGAGLAWLGARRRRAAIAAVGFLTALACARAVTRIPVWQDNTTLYASIIRDAPGSFRADWLAAEAAYDAGQRDEGRALLMRAVSANPREPGLLTYLATRLEEDSNWTGAARVLTSAYHAKPRTTLYAALAIDAFVQGRELDSADAVLRQAWHDSTSTALRIASSNLAFARGRFDEATALRRGVAHQSPGEWRSWAITAEAAEHAGDCGALDEALQWIGRLNPSLPELGELTARRPKVHCRS